MVEIYHLVLKPQKKEGEPSSNQEDVHVPAVNLAEKKRTEKLQEKLERAKEKRSIATKLQKVKTLGESDSDEEDTAAWVRKNRRIQREKTMAEKRAKMLEEMDAEFGIGNLVEEEFHDKRKVEHDLTSFNEGKNYILTLQDKGILDDDIDDTLVNVNIIDNEKAKLNVENKKKKPDYNPYDDAEVDEYGMMKMRNVLDKYDEEIDGTKKSSFELGSGGKYDTAPERQMEKIREQLRQQSHMLSAASLTLANEYYTPEEMVCNIIIVIQITRGRGTYVDPSEDGFPLEKATFDYNHGQTFEYNHGQNSSNADRDDDDMEIDEDMEDRPDIDLTGVPVVEDEANQELQAALEKTRKMKQKKDKNTVNKIAKAILSEQKSPEMESPTKETKGLNIVLNSTSEFCRALGDIPTYGQAGNRDEEKEELMDFERELMEERRRREEEEEQMSGWNRVEIDERPVDIASEETAVLDDEPIANQGVGAALELAKKKGKCFVVSSLTSDLDEKYRKRSDRYSSGIITDFREKEGYKPDVKLEYVDDSGRSLNAKEAFRQLSHRFHGKGSGKRKTEKRNKKLEEEQLMKMMSSTDTPLNTLNLLKDKQKAEKSPFVILTGNKGLATQDVQFRYNCITKLILYLFLGTPLLSQTEKIV
ncbi:hypothetical protein KUTeg_014060 [Tegillarca granosa]|uniref:U4/U6.U5 tri-snRNP-associated protein 1 n=1 Tax=Tegillarca granosa TaxID=220873 RepID=A0ABQ9EVH8_TEGGR|nr:hypothetical protein KUTeg_014060 [Tegillarca granosa]